MKTWPEFKDSLVDLVQRHLALSPQSSAGDTLYAVYYDPRRSGAEQDVFLLEIVDGDDDVSASQEFLEATFATSPAFRLDGDQCLHLIITSPGEFVAALRGHWEQSEELLAACQEGRALLLHPQGGPEPTGLVDWIRDGLNDLCAERALSQTG